MPSEREIKGTMNTCTSNEVTIIEYTQHTCKNTKPEKKNKNKYRSMEKEKKTFSIIFNFGVLLVGMGRKE